MFIRYFDDFMLSPDGVVRSIIQPSQGWDPGSNPGRRIFSLIYTFYYLFNFETIFIKELIIFFVC